MQRPLFFLALLALNTLTAAVPMMDVTDNHKIGVQNSILAKVNGTTISMMDVKKKMDLLFHQNYPHLLNSSQARFQFYETSWRHVMMEMIDQELILADAADKEIKLADAEVREEIENRFGPNVMTTLDKIGISYEETWKLIKNELIVRRMTWWFIHSKAMSKVTPQEIRQSYRLYLKEHPAYSEWTYRVLTIRGDAPAPASEELYNQIRPLGQSPESIEALLREFEAAHSGISISLSTEYQAKDIELSESHKSALASLEPGQYSQPISQVSRDKKEVCRLFYLGAKSDHPAPSFEEISPVLKNEILQKTSGEVSQNYIEKLRKHYRFDSSHLKEMLPEDLTPFAIQ
jgi:hypothetical protein